MNETRKKQILQLAARAGELMLKNGAEVSRVEDTIQRICHACHIDNVEVFALPTGIFMSIEPDAEDGEILSSIRRLRSAGTDLKKISDINQFSRTFTTTDMSVEEGLAELERIDRQPDYPRPVKLLGAGIAAGMFGAIYSGSALTTVFIFLIGILCQLLSYSLGRLHTNFFINGMICCSLAALLSIGCYSVGLASEIDSPIIGAIMLFTPGVPMVNAIRDLLAGDTLTGLARLADTILIALSLATGVGIVLKFYTLANPQVIASEASLPLPVIVLLGALSVAGFAILFHLPARAIPSACIAGGIGWAAYQLCITYGQSVAASVFVGAFLVGGFARVFSRFQKIPTTGFIIPSIIPLLPGALTYYTMQEFFHGGLATGLSLCLDTISVAGAIALGLLAVGALIEFVHRVHHHVKAA